MKTSRKLAIAVAMAAAGLTSAASADIWKFAFTGVDGIYDAEQVFTNLGLGDITVDGTVVNDPIAGTFPVIRDVNVNGDQQFGDTSLDDELNSIEVSRSTDGGATFDYVGTATTFDNYLGIDFRFVLRDIYNADGTYIFPDTNCGPADGLVNDCDTYAVDTTDPLDFTQNSTSKIDSGRSFLDLFFKDSTTDPYGVGLNTATRVSLQPQTAEFTYSDDVSSLRIEAALLGTVFAGLWDTNDLLLRDFNGDSSTTFSMPALVQPEDLISFGITFQNVSPIVGSNDYNLNGDGNVQFVVPVPEPATLALMGLGLLGVGAAGRRIRGRSA